MKQQLALKRHLCVVLVLCGFVAGCGKSEEEGPPRVETYPIRGQVTVDGKPANYLLVTCRPVNEADSKVPTKSSAFTDEDGNFAIGTYEAGDGVPAGEYVLTFEWKERSLLSGRYEGKDKLKGRYSDPTKSEIKITVPNEKENDLGVIALTTK